MNYYKYLIGIGAVYFSCGHFPNVYANLPSYVLEVSQQNQKGTFKGTVLDGNGDPLIGATVKIKGTNDGTITDFDGNFVLKSSKKSVDLEISYVGYETKVINAVKGKTLKIVLKEDSEALEEVVVIGYGRVSKEALTGSVSSVSGKAIAQVPVASAAEAMVGKLAGVQITTADGSPDADIQVRVRGGGSITQDNSPLYIVDGFPVDNLNDIAPTDIESIDVLKDASSTAVYGARGANGVVNITTKRAKEGKATVSFNAYMSLRQVSKKLDVLDPYEFVLLYYEDAKLGSSEPTSFYDKYGYPEEFHIYKDYAGDDWQDEIMGKTTVSQYYSVNIGGSSGKTKYNLREVL